MDSNLIVVLALAFVLLLVVVLLIYGQDEKKKKGPRRAHANGNLSAVQKTLRIFARRHQYRVLGPLTLEKGGKTVRLDGAVAGYFGVLGVKALGYNGQVYGNSGEKQWLWVSADKRENFPNPEDECALAVRVLREALMNAKVRTPEVQAVYVFTDPKAELCIPRNLGAMRLKDFKKFLGKASFTQDKGYDLDALCAALKPFEDKPAE